MKKFKLLSEDQLNQSINTKTLLPSEGDYGLDCLIHEGDVEIEGHWLYDASFYEVTDEFSEAEIGTIAIKGNLKINGDLILSDRLFCLVVIGDVICENFETFQTEVFINGNLKAKTLRDNDSLTTIKGNLLVEKIYKPYEDR